MIGEAFHKCNIFPFFIENYLEIPLQESSSKQTTKLKNL